MCSLPSVNLIAIGRPIVISWLTFASVSGLRKLTVAYDFYFKTSSFLVFSIIRRHAYGTEFYFHKKLKASYAFLQSLYRVWQISLAAP
jgi:hypothetical protein